MYRVAGAKPLEGSITLQAAKNAAVKQLVASLLTSEPCVLHGMPRSGEVDVALQMLAGLGAEVQWLTASTLRVQTPIVRSTTVSEEYSGVNRIPVLLLAPLLHRTGEANIPLSGGCAIGPRPIDFHIDALTRMGATVDTEHSGCRASASRLSGTTIRLRYPSVGATETVLFAAVLAEGVTTLHGAALEPEVIDTVHFLQKMGALIDVRPDRTMIIEGVHSLGGAEHAPVPDRIEAASFATAAVATDGHVHVRGARQGDLLTFLNVLRRIGGGFDVRDDGITFYRERPLTAVDVETDVHPGFATDWQPPLCVLLTQARGRSVLHETVYENRFGYADALRRMGADITLSTNCLGDAACRFGGRGHRHSAVVVGPTPLTAGRVTIPDLRAGFAYLIAALIADGVTELHGVEKLHRGYSGLPQKLADLGCVVTEHAAEQRF